MAEEDTETAEDVVEEPSGGGKKKMIMFGGIGIALIAAGIFAGPVVMNMISPPDEEAVEGAEGAEEMVEETGGPPLYNSLHPPLVVNFKDAVGDVHFMQITMEVMSRDQEVINAVREHTPVIRNNLILLYGSSVYEEVTTRVGKEKMLADGLKEIQEVMTDQIGEPGVEAVFFTSLIIQ